MSNSDRSDSELEDIEDELDTEEVLHTSCVDDIESKEVDVDLQEQNLTHELHEHTSPIIYSHGEQICRETMNFIYGVPFISQRPSWLLNPETGEPLELDCYNEEYRIAVEYNGEQHYHWPNHTDQSYDEFINQVRRDEFKKELCAIHSVYLIIVPFTIPFDDIHDYIYDRLPENVDQ
jgi:hypothetical protein